MAKAKAKTGVWLPPGVPTLPIERLVVPPWNPNEMSQKVFKGLVADIKKDGFLEPILVVSMTDAMRTKYVLEHDGGEYWLIVGGAHRWEAGRLLAMTHLPVVLQSDWDEDKIKLKNVSMNMRRGKMSPEKFTKLYMDVVERHGDELVQEQMGFVEAEALKDLLRDVRENLPPAVREQLTEREGEIHSADDLHRIINEIFSKSGDTLDFGWLVFDFGGHTNYWVAMDLLTKESMDRLAKSCYAAKIDMNRVLTILIRGGSTLEDALEQALKIAADEDVEFG